MKIGILGGTFDPFHLGHLSIGNRAIEEVNLDKLIILPANVSPFKVGNEMAEESHRIGMLERVVEEEPQFELSRFEIDKENVSYTFETMEALRKSHPEDNLFFILGSDSFESLESWYEGKELLASTPFIVGKRHGISNLNLERKANYYRRTYGSQIILMHNKILEISSTEIKDRIKKGLEIKDLVPPVIERYIISHGLYK